MIRPLLRILPSLSGNIKLACQLNDYKQIDKNTFEVECKHARLYPLSSEAFQSLLDVSLFQSSWEFDVPRFYKQFSDIFYKNTFTYNKDNYLYIKNPYSVIKDRNSDMEFGCKRISYEKSNKQLAFFAPIYCDNVDDLPDYFEIELNIQKNSSSKIQNIKKIRINLQSGNTNYLALYLKRYLSKIDDNVIYLMPNSNQALYYGIDVQHGGFNTFVDNVISKIFTTETTVNGYDACINNGFKRNSLIARQFIPLAFYFNLNDILTEQEAINYKYAIIKVKGHYVKNSQVLPFYLLDEEYESFSESVLIMDDVTGKMQYQVLNENILAKSEKLALPSNNVSEYTHSNKVLKFYNRWMLKYSDIEHPYITNTNYLFSINQNLENLYYQQPQNYIYTMALGDIKYSNNIFLPLGSNIDKYYSGYETLVNKYKNLVNNYITNWFNVIYDTDDNYIMNNKTFVDVNKNNKVMFNGNLFDLNKLNTELDMPISIDKFGIFMYVNDSYLFSNDTIKNYICSKYSISDSLVKNTAISLDFSSSLSNVDENVFKYKSHNTTTTSYSDINLFNINTTINNTNLELEQYFTYHTPTIIDELDKNSYYTYGYYIDFNSLGNFYDINKYYVVNDKFIDELATYNINIPTTDGYELLEIPYASNIKIANDNINEQLDNEVVSHLYYSVYPYSTIKSIADNKDEFLNIYTSNTKSEINDILFYQKIKVVSYYDIAQASYLSKDIKNSIVTSIISNREVSYFPKYELNNNKFCTNVFIPIDNNNKFYGNNAFYYDMYNYNDVLYVDNSNINIENYYQFTGNVVINDIQNNNNLYTITFSDLYNKDTVLSVNCEESVYKKQFYYLDTTNTYIANIFNNGTIPAYFYTDFPKTITKLTNLFNDTTGNYGYYGYYITDTTKITVSDNSYYKSSKYIINGYVSHIDYESYIITINNNNVSYSNTFKLLCSDINHTYSVAYKLDAIKYIKTNKGTYTYINNYNGIGTYWYKQTPLYKHPEKLLTEITNVSYIDTIDKYSKTREIKLVGNEKFVVKAYFDNQNTDVLFYDNKFYQNGSIPNIIKKLYNINGSTINMYVRITTPEQFYFIRDVLLKNETNKNRFFYKRTRNICLNNIDKTIKKDVVNRINNHNNINNIPSRMLDGEIFYYCSNNIIKLDSTILYDFMKFNDSSLFNDMLIFRLESDYSMIANTDTIVLNDNNIDKDNTIVDNHLFVTPFFNKVSSEYLEDTKLYKEFNNNRIKPISFYDKNNQIVATNYMYNKPDKLMLVDIRLFENVLKYNSNITKLYELLNTGKIETYDKIDINSISFIKTNSANDELFDKYKINVVTDNNGKTHGFFLYELNMYNVNTFFNGMVTDNTELQELLFFDKINNISIINNHNYLTKIIKQIIPFMKINIINYLYNIPFFVKPFKTTFNKKYKRVYDSKIGKNHIIYDPKNEQITLYRYYDCIIPKFNQTSIVYTDYMLKTTQTKQITLSGDIYYQKPNNIYNYEGIRVYKNSLSGIDWFNLFQLEYKYYNDNKFINLEPEIIINVSDTLTQEKLFEMQSEIKAFEYFKNSILEHNYTGFNDDEILFLFNKYKVTMLSNPTNNKNGVKLYALTYKFNLY